jgi:hypothetical protein
MSTTRSRFSTPARRVAPPDGQKSEKKVRSQILRFKAYRELHHATGADSTCQSVDGDVHDAHSEPSGLAGRRKSRHSLIVRDTHNERGRAVKCSRSSLAMPQRKPVGSRSQCSSKTPCSHAEPAPPRYKCHQLLPRRSCQHAVRRTVMSMWGKCMTCIGAWLGGRGLAYGSGRTHPTRSERQRGRPPTLYRAAASKRIASGVEGSAAARPLHRSTSRLGECTSQPARLVHSSLAFAVLCPAEAAREPSSALRSFSRIFLALLV